ncbi:helix-turn-helix domain-containing protein [Anaerocolumna sp. MB42-C2]|uniref:helix-turn-helix domain-containing protein n=1 Tax=Anaerocolumna sp. MB42-C2 TaxID=3070997 RepID=UPI0027DEB4AF|nr:helix-turn-helix transcriptional regulator [Anaerocolumna sp. MB42-C2]WMJ89243.1 helix-turn-helix transcriptional regulator [Anaerocolumna sp. MB42-C2]
MNSDKVKAVEEKLQLAKSDLERIYIVECFLISEINFDTKDSLIAIAIEKIKLFNGNIRIAEIAKELFISEITFERRFKRNVGTTPKKFALIIRLRYILDQMDRKGYIDEIMHYDQAHFIKEFKSLTGLTPKEYQRHNKGE